ncbi:enoyl-CoA hydratase/isomerase family protein [Achromobacter aloeverae]
MSVVMTYHGKIAVIELNRPEALNALNDQMLADLNRAFDEIDVSACRGVVFVGSGGKAFCAGADIAQLRARTLAEHRSNVKLGQSTFTRIERLPIPSVAVMHGFAFGGGLELALGCWFRVATSKAKMGLPEVKLGLIPAYGGTQRLARLIGEARATEMILSGESVNAGEALKMGLVNRLVDDSDPTEIGLSYLKPFTEGSRTATALAREAIHRGISGGLQAGLDVEADVFNLCVQSKDAAEGMAAFLEKRSAKFSD